MLSSHNLRSAATVSGTGSPSALKAKKTSARKVVDNSLSSTQISGPPPVISKDEVEVKKMSSTQLTYGKVTMQVTTPAHAAKLATDKTRTQELSALSLPAVPQTKLTPIGAESSVAAVSVSMPITPVVSSGVLGQAMGLVSKTQTVTSGGQLFTSGAYAKNLAIPFLSASKKKVISHN